MPITRRIFMRNSALAVVGTAAVPSFLTRAAFGAVGASSNHPKRLVILFQRGAADGLNIVVPHHESAYYAMRPTINIPRNQVLDLDGFFGLHRRWRRFSCCGSRSISQSCMRQARLIQRARTSTHRTLWSRALRA